VSELPDLLTGILPILGAALAGYLVGSISFARIVGGRVAPSQDLTVTEYEIDPAGTRIFSRGVSPASVGSRAGGRWGCLTALLDIAKAFAVTMAFGVVAPGTGAEYAAATGAVIGHAYPIYHPFVGGFGSHRSSGHCSRSTGSRSRSSRPAAPASGSSSRTR
jgi:glycerol-3-phosphate acyltransferase PlsY